MRSLLLRAKRVSDGNAGAAAGSRSFRETPGTCSAWTAYHFYVSPNLTFEHYCAYLPARRRCNAASNARSPTSGRGGGGEPVVCPRGPESCTGQPATVAVVALQSLRSPRAYPSVALAFSRTPEHVRCPAILSL